MMSNAIKSIRFTYLIGLMLIIGLLGAAAYLEIYKGINPCSLCILQRGVLVALGVIFLIALVLTKKISHIICGCLGLITALLGILLAGRQVWLQHMPQNGSGECGISLPYLFKIFSFPEAIKHLWRGGIECSQHGWVFLHLSLAEWSLLWFLIFFILVMVQVKRVLNNK